MMIIIVVNVMESIAQPKEVSETFLKTGQNGKRNMKRKKNTNLIKTSNLVYFDFIELAS